MPCVDLVDLELFRTGAFSGDFFVTGAASYFFGGRPLRLTGEDATSGAGISTFFFLGSLVAAAFFVTTFSGASAYSGLSKDLLNHSVYYLNSVMFLMPSLPSDGAGFDEECPLVSPLRSFLLMKKSRLP